MNEQLCVRIWRAPKTPISYTVFRVLSIRISDINSDLRFFVDIRATRTTVNNLEKKKKPEKLFSSSSSIISNESSRTWSRCIPPESCSGTPISSLVSEYSQWSTTREASSPGHHTHTSLTSPASHSQHWRIYRARGTVTKKGLLEGITLGIVTAAEYEKRSECLSTGEELDTCGKENSAHCETAAAGSDRTAATTAMPPRPTLKCRRRGREPCLRPPPRGPTGWSAPTAASFGDIHTAPVSPCRPGVDVAPKHRRRYTRTAAFALGEHPKDSFCVVPVLREI